MARKVYDNRTKRQAVELYFEGHSVPTIMEKLEINQRRSIYKWINVVKAEGFDALSDQRKNNTGRPNKTTLEEEYELLKVENAYLKKLLLLRKGGNV
ncbi:helix-turn-helix domain-containing protein [Oceanobacillus sp. CAU 1775]